MATYSQCFTVLKCVRRITTRSDSGCFDPVPVKMVLTRVSVFTSSRHCLPISHEAHWIPGHIPMSTESSLCKGLPLKSTKNSFGELLGSWTYVAPGTHLCSAFQLPFGISWPTWFPELLESLRHVNWTQGHSCRSASL